jgi:hypothetical protein
LACFLKTMSWSFFAKKVVPNFRQNRPFFHLFLRKYFENHNIGPWTISGTFSPNNSGHTVGGVSPKWKCSAKKMNVLCMYAPKKRSLPGRVTQWSSHTPGELKILVQIPPVWP